MTKRSFDVRDVLTVTTGMMLSKKGMSGLYDILNYLTGSDLCTHQLPRAAEEAEPHIFKQVPELDSLEMKLAVRELLSTLNTTTSKNEAIDNWVLKLINGDYGITVDEMIELEPLPTGAYMSLEPIDELELMTDNSITF